MHAECEKIYAVLQLLSSPSLLSLPPLPLSLTVCFNRHVCMYVCLSVSLSVFMPVFSILSLSPSPFLSYSLCVYLCLCISVSLTPAPCLSLTICTLVRTDTSWCRLTNPITAITPLLIPASLTEPDLILTLAPQARISTFVVFSSVATGSRFQQLSEAYLRYLQTFGILF